MKISRTKLAKAIADQTLSKASSSKLTKEIAAYLLVNNRVGELSSIMRDVSIYYSELGIIEVNTISAFPLSSTVKDNIKAKVKQVYPNLKKIIINEQVDESLIAGVKVELPNGLIDLSVETKLNKFKQLAAIGKGI